MTAPARIVVEMTMMEGIGPITIAPEGAGNGEDKDEQDLVEVYAREIRARP